MDCQDFGDPTGKFHTLEPEEAKFRVVTFFDVVFYLCYPCVGSFVEYMDNSNYPITISIIE
jgi:hypothetical protein